MKTDSRSLISVAVCLFLLLLFSASALQAANIRNGLDHARGSAKIDGNFAYKHPFDGRDWPDLKKHQPFFSASEVYDLPTLKRLHV